MRHEITNDLIDIESILPITNWNLSNDEETVYSFNKIGINLSDPDKQLEVNGEARIRDNLQVDSSLLLGKDGAYLKVEDDNHIYFFDKDGMRHEITNDLMDTDNDGLIPITNWNLSNDEETVYSFNKIGINLSDPDKQLEVNGEARIRDNLQVDSSLLLGKDGAYLKVEDDNHIYFFDKDGMRHEITNDLMDTDNDGLIPITNWNLSNNEETVYSFNKIGINISDPNKQLEVNGEARIRDNLQVDSSLLLGTNGAYLKVEDDNHIYFFDKDGMRHEITNDLVDIESILPITNWNLSNDEETVYSFNKIGINISDPDKQLEVNGEARIRDNLQVDSNLLLGTNGAYLKVEDDNHIYFFDKDGMRHEITNDLMDIESILPITNWNLSNDEETVYSFNKIGINMSNPGKQLEVNGEARIRDNLQVDSNLKLGTDGAYFKVDTDNQIYFFDKDGIKHEITNDLVDSEVISELSSWNIDNNTTTYSFNKIGINLSNPDKQFEVNGEARIRDNLQVDSILS